MWTRDVQVMKGSHLCGRINHTFDNISGAQQMADPERIDMLIKNVRARKHLPAYLYSNVYRSCTPIWPSAIVSSSTATRCTAATPTHHRTNDGI